MSRPGKDIWRDLEAAMQVTAARIREADMHGIEVGARLVAAIATELADAVGAGAAESAEKPEDG